MIIKNDGQSTTQGNKVKLIPKHQQGGKPILNNQDTQAMVDTPVTTSSAGYVQGTNTDTTNRLYSPTSNSNLVSTNKRTDSVRGSLSGVVTDYINTHKGSIKLTDQQLKQIIAKAPSTGLRGQEELNHYAALHPELAKIINDPTTIGALRKRGFDINNAAQQTPMQSTQPAQPVALQKKGGTMQPTGRQAKQLAKQQQSEIVGSMKKGGELNEKDAKLVMKKGGKNWIQGVDKSIEKRGTEGKCTPITKPGCTGKAKTLAKTFKKMASKRKKD